MVVMNRMIVDEYSCWKHYPHWVEEIPANTEKRVVVRTPKLATSSSLLCSTMGSGSMSLVTVE